MLARIWHGVTLTLSLGDSLESVKRFAGDAYERARYYAEDGKFLLEFEPAVQHYQYFEEEKRDVRDSENY